MKTKHLFRILPLLCLGFLVACGGNKDAENTTESTAVKVNVVQTSLQMVDETATYTANVEAEVLNNITPTIPGRIEKIFVDVGANVSKGQLLAQMESTSLQQQRTQLDNLERDYQRYVELLKVGGIAQQTVDQAKAQLDVMKTAIGNIEENTKLRSPINGVVTARNYDNGNVFGQEPILTVQQLNPLKAVVYVSESLFSKVKQGMPVEVRLDVYQDEVFAGKVSLIHPTIDPATHTFGVEVSIANQDMRVRPGMYSRVTFNFGQNESIVVADRAVQKQSGSNDKYVYVIENNIARYRKVELGLRLADKYEIRSGVTPGETVVVDGQTRLVDGTAVEIMQKQ